MGKKKKKAGNVRDFVTGQIMLCLRMEKELSNLVYSSPTRLAISIDTIQKVSYVLNAIGRRLHQLEYGQMTDNNLMELNQRYSSLQSKLCRAQIDAIRASSFA